MSHDTRSTGAEVTLASPSPVARRLLWHVLGLSRAWYGSVRRFEPFGRPGAVLLWVESGTGTLDHGTTRWELERGPTFWLFPLDRPRVFTPEGNSLLIIRTIRFSGPGLAIWLEALGGSSRIEHRLPSHTAAAVRATQKTLLRLVNAKPAEWEWRAHLTLTLLLHRFLAARRVFCTGQAHLPEPITRALNAIEAEPFRDWKARELAAAAGMNYSSFRTLFRQSMHESAHEHLQRRRVELAQVLLADQRLQIKQIAQRLHFASDYYFSYLFRHETGMSPTEFRKHIGAHKPQAATSAKHHSKATL